MRRVVRLISVVSSLASSRDSVRLTADGVCPTCSAAAEIDPHSITQTKICNSSDLAFTWVPYRIFLRQIPNGMGLLWRGGLHPFDCAAVAKPVLAVCQKKPTRWFQGRFAAQRGQATSPQVRLSIVADSQALRPNTSVKCCSYRAMSRSMSGRFITSTHRNVGKPVMPRKVLALWNGKYTASTPLASKKSVGSSNACCGAFQVRDNMYCLPCNKPPLPYFCDSGGLLQGKQYMLSLQQTTAAVLLRRIGTGA